MTWRIWYTPYETAGELTDQSIFQPLDPKRNMILEVVRTWVVLVGDPVLTSLSMDLYTDSGGSPGSLIASSEAVTKAELLTLDHGIKEAGFLFDSIPLTNGTTYHLVLTGSGYAPTSNSWIGWRRAYPVPVYSAGYTPTLVNSGIAPYEVSILGADL